MLLDDDRNIPLGRLSFLALMVLAAVGILISRLYTVQLAQGEAYTQKLRTQTTVATRLSPARGAITDRNGIALAENRASFDIDFYLDELQRNYSRVHRGRLPMTRVQVKRRGEIKEVEQVDIVKIVNEAIEPIARSLGFSNRPDEREIREHYRTQKEIPYQFRTDVDFNTLAQFSERNLGVPGIDIVARPVRRYNFGAFASHILGYVGKPDDNSEAKAEDDYPYETVGRQGIEARLDSKLQGKPGGKILRVNYRGYVDREEEVKPPTVGYSVKLTIDARIQYIVEQAMRGVGRGAAVIMDPKTGDVLAMCSVPSYDPNVFIPKISGDNWKSLIGDPTSPLTNRALSSYPPGSIYKPFISLAALKSGAITKDTVINSPGVVYIGGHPFKDWSPGGQGAIKLLDGLRMSCNTFFYQAGVRTGIKAIDELGDIVGFGQSTGIDLSPESKGIMPGPDYLKKVSPRERWTEAYTANVSIGQGAVQVTPVQMCILMCAIANGGHTYRPRLIQEVVDLDGTQQAEYPTCAPRNPETPTLGVKKSDIEAVKAGLLAVVADGTGRRGQVEGVKVAGKTGTAQAWRRVSGAKVQDNKTWFYGFAPFDDPRYVFLVFVEGGTSGGGTCAPIAHDIMNNIFAMEKGKDIQLTYLTPSSGHFHGVVEVQNPLNAQPAGSTPSNTGANAPAAVPADTTTDNSNDNGGGEPSIVPEDDAPSIMPKRRN